jgi:hypothetical protein
MLVVLRVKVQENPLNGRPATAENELCSSHKVPLISDRSQPYLICTVYVLGARCDVS